jgi:hypothetical protein
MVIKESVFDGSVLVRLKGMEKTGPREAQCFLLTDTAILGLREKEYIKYTRRQRVDQQSHFPLINFRIR